MNLPSADEARTQSKVGKIALHRKFDEECGRTILAAIAKGETMTTCPSHVSPSLLYQLREKRYVVDHMQEYMGGTFVRIDWSKK